MWNLKNGFLPSKIVSSSNEKLELLAKEIPYLISTRKIREELVSDLRGVPISFDEPERLMQIFSYFASAYIHAKHENTQTRLPKEIAVPLVKLSGQLSRPPILSYASYCLYNWTCKGSFYLDNLSLNQNFCLEDKRDEDGFILIHVAIEHEAIPIITIMQDKFDNDKLAWALNSIIFASLSKMNNIMNLMPKYCDSNVYFSSVRPYIFGFNNVIYEGCFSEPRTYRGETGAQSSIVPALLEFFGIKHEDTLLTNHLKDMRNYMPKEHREFLSNIKSIREIVQSKGCKDAYNKCLEEIIKFRKKHLEYAVSYIAEKVENPTGTGGTPYIPWLSKLIEETQKFYFE